MSNEPVPNYFSYLVRLWRLNDTAMWRATLQDPHTGQKFLFDSVESLFSFLNQQLGKPASVVEQPTDAPSDNIVA
jgi:hypothetical protein